MTLTPLPAAQALDNYFLDARARLLDLAAILDRIDRGGFINDPRMERIRSAVEVLSAPQAERAAKVQQLFSLPYDPNWKRPTPK